MELFTCCCKWQWIIGKKKVYGAIYSGKDSSSVRMTSRTEWEDWNSDCAACYKGLHKHSGNYHPPHVSHWFPPE